MKLISTTDFVLHMVDKHQFETEYTNNNSFVSETINYANFLKKPLELGVFVPVDNEGNVLEEPHEGMFEIKANEKCSGWKYLKKDNEHEEDSRHYDDASYQDSVKQYQKAKDNVLFKGDWKLLPNDGRGVSVVDPTGYTKKLGRIYLKGTIEDLIPYNLELTQKAIQLINK